MTIQKIMNNITPIILYFQEVAANDIVSNLIHMLTYDIYQAIPCLEIVLNHLWDITSDPMVILLFP